VRHVAPVRIAGVRDRLKVALDVQAVEDVVLVLKQVPAQTNFNRPLF